MSLPLFLFVYDIALHMPEYADAVYTGWRSWIGNLELPFPLQHRDVGFGPVPPALSAGLPRGLPAAPQMLLDCPGWLRWRDR